MEDLRKSITDIVLLPQKPHPMSRKDIVEEISKNVGPTLIAMYQIIKEQQARIQALEDKYSDNHTTSQ